MTIWLSFQLAIAKTLSHLYGNNTTSALGEVVCSADQELSGDGLLWLGLVSFSSFSCLTALTDKARSVTEGIRQQHAPVCVRVG